MDERVIDYRWFFRALLVKGIILKTRPKKSAAAYKTVWTDEGSPLVVITKQIQQKLQKLVDIPVEIGMRYAEPSIETGIRNLVEKGVEEIVLFPLYPQYAMSTTETVVEKAKEVQAKFFPNVKINYVKPFTTEIFTSIVWQKASKKNCQKILICFSFRITVFLKDIFTKQILPKLVKLAIVASKKIILHINIVTDINV
jgi:ferrochelatase